MKETSQSRSRDGRRLAHRAQNSSYLALHMAPSAESWPSRSFSSGFICPCPSYKTHPGETAVRRGGAGGESPCSAHMRAWTCEAFPLRTLTPHNQVSRGFVNPPRVGGQAGVGAGIGDVRRADKQAPRLEQREARQLDGAAGQDALP